jgi:small-conductance mechanosensitive channel
MTLEDILARYATSAFGFALLVAMAAARSVTHDEAYRRDLRGAEGYLLLFLGTAFLRALTPDRWHKADKGIFVAGLVLFSFGLIRGVAATWSLLHRRRTGVETPKILRDLVDGILFVLALLVILQATLDIDLTAVLASSAVISLVLGLALQETLGNLFAGLSLQAERPFGEGDWVKIGDYQGKVVEIGWRATKLLTGSGEGLTIPNNAVAKGAVLNLSRRGSVMRKVTLALPYDVPPNALKDAVLTVLRAHPRIVDEPAPLVRTAELGASAIQYEALFWVGRWEQGGEVEDEVRSQLWYRLQRAGLALEPVGTEVRVARAARVAAQPGEVDVRALLAQVDFLAPVEPRLRDALAARARVARFGRGEVVLRQGDTSPAPFYVVAAGEMSVRVHTSAGRDDEVARLGPGEFFGEMAALTGEPRTATVAAARDSALVAVDREAFSELFERAPEVAHALAGVLAKRREGLVKTIEKAATGSVRPPEEPHQLLDQLRGIFKNLA